MACEKGVRLLYGSHFHREDDGMKTKQGDINHLIKKLVFHVCVHNVEVSTFGRIAHNDKVFDVKLRIINYDHLLSSYATMIRKEPKIQLYILFFFVLLRAIYASLRYDSSSKLLQIFRKLVCYWLFFNKAIKHENNRFHPHFVPLQTGILRYAHKYGNMKPLSWYDVQHNLSY